MPVPYYRLSLTISRVLKLGTILGLICSCTIQHSSRPHSPTIPTQVSAANQDSLGAARSIRESLYLPGQLRYTLQLHSVVQSIPPDTLHGPDSTYTTAVVTAVFLPRDSTRVSASITVDSLRLTALGSTSRSFPSWITQFSINLQTSQVFRVPTPSEMPSGCNTQLSGTSISGAEVLPQIPLPLKLSWTDTTDSQLCRTGVMITVRRVSVYKPITGNSIARSTHMVMTGSGKQWNQPVTVSGQGTSQDTISLGNEVPIRVDQITGTSQLDLLFSSPLQSQHFNQTTSFAIKRQ